MPRGCGSNRRILRGRRSIRPGRQLHEEQISNVLEEGLSSDDGDFSSGSGDDYDPERNENQNTSTESGSSTEPDEETPPGTETEKSH